MFGRAKAYQTRPWLRHCLEVLLHVHYTSSYIDICNTSVCFNWQKVDGSFIVHVHDCVVFILTPLYSLTMRKWKLQMCTCGYRANIVRSMYMYMYLSACMLIVPS